MPTRLADLLEPPQSLADLLEAPEESVETPDIDPRAAEALRQRYEELLPQVERSDERDANVANRMGAQFGARSVRAIQSLYERVRANNILPAWKNDLSDDEAAAAGRKAAEILLNPYLNTPEREAAKRRHDAEVENMRNRVREDRENDLTAYFDPGMRSHAGFEQTRQMLFPQRRLGQETPQDKAGELADITGFVASLMTPGSAGNLAFRGGEKLAVKGLTKIPVLARAMPAVDAVGRIARAGVVAGAGGAGVALANPVTPSDPLATTGETLAANAANVGSTAAGFAIFGAGARTLGEAIPGIAYRYSKLTPEQTMEKLEGIFARAKAGEKVTGEEGELVRQVTRHLAERGETIAPYQAGEKGLASIIRSPRDWTQITPLREVLDQPMVALSTVPGSGAARAAAAPAAPAELGGAAAPPPVPAAPRPSMPPAAPAAGNALAEFEAMAGMTPAAPPAPATPTPSDGSAGSDGSVPSPPATPVPPAAPQAQPRLADIVEPPPAATLETPVPPPASAPSGELFAPEDIPFNLASEAQAAPEAPASVQASGELFAPSETQSFPPTALDRANAGAVAQTPKKAAPVVEQAIVQQPAQGFDPSAAQSGLRVENTGDLSGGRQVRKTLPKPSETSTPKSQIRKRPALEVPPVADGSIDILNIIGELGGVRLPSHVSNPGGEYDGFSEAFDTGVARLLRNRRAQAIDQVMVELREMGFKFDTPDDLYRAVESAKTARLRAASRKVTEDFTEKTHAALFENKGRNPRLGKSTPIPAEQLISGDTLRIRGETYTVTSIDPDTGAATLQGGVQITVPPDSIIYPDKGSHKHAPKESPQSVDPYEAPVEYGGEDRSQDAGVRGRSSEGAASGSPAHYLTDPIKYAGPLADALAQSQRVSSIAADYDAGAIPNWNPVGAIVKTSADMAALFQPLRNPTAEISKFAVIDASGRVLTAQIQQIGKLNTTGFNIGQIISEAKKQGAKRVVFSHNHPSGDPTPSPQDHVAIRHISAELAKEGIELVDSIVTNGHAFYSHAHGDVLPMDFESPPSWELVPRRALAHIDDARQFETLAAAMRQRNPDAAFIVYANNKIAITAVEQLPPDAIDFSAGMSRVFSLASRVADFSKSQGASSIFLSIPKAFDDGIVRELANALSNRGIALNDISTPQIQSMRMVGRMPPIIRRRGSAPASVSESAEESAPYGPPEFAAQPAAVRLPNGEIVPLELGGLREIPIIQMPEMVRLARDLTGRFPEIKRLARGVRGVMRAAEGSPESARIVLNPAIFRDPVQAAKTLAHEIGHLVDFLPDAILARGNILGNLATLRKFLATSLPINPATNAITQNERRALRRAAEKQAGPRPRDPSALDAWRKDVAAKYSELLAARMKRDNVVTARQVREELWNLSTYWRPLPENPTPGHLSYRESPEELYADAISVLFNSPGTLKAMAPTFYATFFSRLDNKPEIKTALFDLWNFLSKPHLQTLQRRSADIQAMFAKGDEIIMRKAAERKALHATFRGWMDRVRQELFDTFDPLVRRGAKLERAGMAIPDRINPRLLFDEHPLADNANYRMTQRIFDQVVRPVEADEFTLGELGEYLFLNRILNDTAGLPGTGGVAGIGEGRALVANPLGITPHNARLGILRMRLAAGPERFARLTEAAQKFHAIVFEQIRAAADAGVYSRKVYNEILLPNKDTYASFAVLDHLQDYVPAGIKMSQGTFKEIANPFTATILKMISLNRLIQLNKSKRGAADFLTRFFPDEITPAPRTFDGKRYHVRAPEGSDRALLELLDDGKPAGFHVDPSIVRMFEKNTPAWASAVTTLLHYPFRRFIYPLIIQYNPAFQLFTGPLRDIRRSWVNMPGATGFRQTAAFLRNYLELARLAKPGETGRAIRAHLHGQSTPLTREMVATRAIGTPYQNMRRDLFRNENDAMMHILRDYRIAPGAVVPRNEYIDKILKPVEALAARIEFAGQSFEMLPKIEAYRTLTRDLGWARREAAYFLRNSVGVPNIHRKGRHTLMAEALAPFFKVFVNGLRNDAALATAPKTRGGWWFRWLASDGIWTVMQALAKLGLLGAAIKQLYDGISDYNLTNYNVLPIGTESGGEFGQRVRYVRLPRDEAHRLLSGALYQSILAAGNTLMPPDENGRPPAPGAAPANVLAFGGDQIPGLNPMIGLANAWQEYLEGDNPRDGFRNSPRLTNDQWLAGGWPALKGMIGFTAQQTGVTNFVRWNPDANTTTELVFSAIPGINRLTGVTDAGYRERQLLEQREETAVGARIRVQLPDSALYLLRQYNALTRIKPDLRTPEQAQKLETLKHWKSVYDDMMDSWLETPDKPVPARDKKELDSLSRDVQAEL